MININQREELADYQRHARHTMGLNGSGHGHGIPGWSGNPTATTAAAMGRLATNMSSGTGAFNLGYGGRSRCASAEETVDVFFLSWLFSCRGGCITVLDWWAGGCGLGGRGYIVHRGFLM